MKLLIVVAALLVAGLSPLVGCVKEPPGTATVEHTVSVGGALGVNVYRVHDAEAGVTCWVTTYRGALSCLPDSQIHPKKVEGR